MDGTISVNIWASQIGLSRLLKRKIKVFRSFWGGVYGYRSSRQGKSEESNDQNKYPNKQSMKFSMIDNVLTIIVSV